MTKHSLTNYLQQNNQTLGSMLTKLNALNQWNQWLSDCLPDEQMLAKHCQIVGLEKQALIVIADNANWVTRFRFYIPHVLQKLKLHPELQMIQAICCKVRPTQHAAAPKKARTKPMVISAENAEIILDTASKIKDKRLKTILERIASHTKPP